MENESYNEEVLARQMFENMDWFDNTREAIVNGELKITLNENFGNCLHDMHRFARRVSSDDCMGYKWKKDKFGKVILDHQKYAEYFVLLNQFSDQCQRLNGRAPTEYVQLVFDAFKALKLLDFQFSKPGNLYIEGAYEADLFNSLIVWIRNQSRSKEFQKMMSVRQYNDERNFNSAVTYFEKLKEKHADLLVIRIDLGYREDLAGTFDIDLAKSDIKHMLNNRRTNSIFDSNVGYIAKLELTPKKWLHFHVVFFFNGAIRKKHEWIAQKIGGYWVSFITGGRGVFHNCNREKYRENGIGQLHYSDQTKSEIFINRVIRYMTKTDNYIRCYFGRDVRLFFKGIISDAKSAAGRPRMMDI